MTVSRQGWAYEIVEGGARDGGGFALYEVRFWTSPERQRDGLGLHVIDGQPCDLMNNYRMQIRTNHQRIVTFPDGERRHVSGLVVPARLVGDELATLLTGRGLPLGGYEPFRFPNYAGVEELLDGMWQHELVTVPLLGQAEANIERYIDVAIREGWEGDRRGTTLNLQVSESAGDAEELQSNNDTGITGATVPFGNLNAERDVGFQFSSVTGLAGVVIDAATLTFRASTNDSGSFVGDWFAHDAEAPAVFSAGTGNADISGRTRTTATCEGDGSDFGTWSSGQDHTFTGDGTNTIADILQELADSYDPSAIALVHIYTSGIGERNPTAYDGDTALAPKLDIDFTGAATHRSRLSAFEHRR